MTDAHVNETIRKVNMALQTLHRSPCDQEATRASRELSELHLPALEGAGAFYAPIVVEVRSLQRWALAERLQARLTRTT